MSLFDFLLSLLLVLNPGISEADFNNVYSVLDDTAIHSIVVEDSAFSKLSQLNDFGVMSLDDSSSAPYPSGKYPISQFDVSLDNYNVAVGGLYRMNGAGASIITGQISAVSLSRSGSSFSFSGSFSVDELTDNSTFHYIPLSLGLGRNLGYVEAWEAVPKYLFVTLPDGVYSYQMGGTLHISSSFGGTVVSHDQVLSNSHSLINNTGITSSAEPLALTVTSVSIDAVNRSWDGSSGVYPYSCTIDFSDVYVYLNYSDMDIRMALPSGQYLGASGKPVSGTNVPAYTYLTQGFLGLGSHLLYPVGYYYLDYLGNQRTNSSPLLFSDLVGNGFLGLRAQLWVRNGMPYISTGGVQVASSGMTFSDFMSNSLAGLSYNIAGSDKQAVFSFLQEDIKLPAQSVTADNVLDALAIMGTQLQNPLQKLAFVFANPLDLEIRENVEDNMEEANDGFFKPDSDGSVKGSDIKDAAGITSGLKDSLSSPVSVGDLFSQFGSDSNFLYYSEQTRADLDTVSSPAVVSEDPMDDYQWIYDLDSDGDGYVSFYDSNALTDFLKGG